MAILLSNRANQRFLPIAILVTLTIVYLTFHRPLNAPSSPVLQHKLYTDESHVPPAAAVNDPYDAPIADRPTNEVRTVVAGAGSPVAHTSAASGMVEASIPTPECPPFERLLSTKPGPPSAGKRAFPSARPVPACRTFPLPSLESQIARLTSQIADPDLARLFENSYPNTLDTMVKWKGYRNRTEPRNGTVLAEQTDEELSYIITGDIDAMWLRDSASQLYSYRSLLEPSADPSSLASLWRGLVNAHARAITISPYCHSFQPPPESGIEPTFNGANRNNNPIPAFDPSKVFDCKWELDSLASFLQISAEYHERTGDAAFFGRYAWVDAVQAAVDAAGAMRRGTYDEDGKVLGSAYTFTGFTNRGSETLTNDGLGNPSRECGMVRTAFRPSDDATIFQFLVPANMMWAKYLEEASHIMEALAQQPEGNARAKNLTVMMREFAQGVRRGIDAEGVVRHRKYGDIYAFEVDGFGGANLMDDSNLPSLLAAPLYNYSRSSVPGNVGGGGGKGKTAAEHDAIYANTRRFALSSDNPYWAQGPVLSAVGGPHAGPGKGWPMAAIAAGMTAFDVVRDGKERKNRTDAVEDEVAAQLGQVLDSTGGWGVIHETVEAYHAETWTRAWFGWANGLFGELVLRIEEEEKKSGKKKGEGLLGRSWQ